MSRAAIEFALIQRGYKCSESNRTGHWLCYKKPNGLPKSRAVVWIKRDGLELMCGPTYLTAEPCPELLEILRKQGRDHNA